MRKTYQELEFKDAFMFAAVMSDAESCRGVLERILGIPIRKVMVHKEENDLLITKLRTQITDLKKNRGMEENYMLFGEMLDEERRQGQKEGLKEGLQQGKMDILLKLLQEHKIDVKTAASIMGMDEDEFAKAVKECQEV